MEEFDYSAVIPNAIVLPEDSQCARCGLFDVTREDVRDALRAAGKPIHFARCRGHAEPEYSQSEMFKEDQT